MNLLEMFKELNETEKEEFIQLILKEVNKENIKLIKNETNKYRSKFATHVEIKKD